MNLPIALLGGAERRALTCPMCEATVFIHSITSSDPECPEMMRIEQSVGPWFGIVGGPPYDNDPPSLIAVCSDACLKALIASEGKS